MSVPGLLLCPAAHAGGCNTGNGADQREPHLLSAVQAGGGDGHDDERPGRGHGDPGGTVAGTAGPVRPGGEKDPRHDFFG